MQRIFHHYSLWEDYHAGMYAESKDGRAVRVQRAAEILGTPAVCREAMEKVIAEWKISTEYNLSNLEINRKAWLGQAACCCYAGIHEDETREAWGIMTDQHISWTFDNFERVYVSFSAGKDSTCMLHMVMDEAIKRGRKIGVLLIDLEGQYKKTIDHAEKCRKLYKDHSDWYWVCLPIHLRNAVSVYEPFWKCWDKEAEQQWIRPMPKDCIKDLDYFPFFEDGMEFEEFVPLFGEWYSQGKSCACCVGIRSDESLNRYRTIANRYKTPKDGKMWTTKVTEHTYNVYPIYDWATEDDWIYQGKNPDKPYNELYDYMHLAGLTIHQMRICQPYGDDQRRGLWLFHLIEPETWARVVARVNGANSGAMYINESGNVNGYRKITKPAGHTWKSFATLLINSMPPKTQDHYKNKIYKFVKWWETRGYPDGIPDEADIHLENKKDVPSWRRICKSLLRNDFWCKGLSFTQQRSVAYEAYLQRVKKEREQQETDQLHIGEFTE